MSVDNIAHLGSQGLDELVPSRYALQVGDIEVLVISDRVPPITGKTIAYNADSADLASWLDDMFLPPDVLEWPLNVAVVRSGDRTILIDAGSGGPQSQPRMDRGVDKQLLVQPADIVRVGARRQLVDGKAGHMRRLRRGFPQQERRVLGRDRAHWSF